MKTTVRYWLAGLVLLMAGGQIKAQVTLTTSPYVQDFNGLGSGLPTGWSVRTGATATSTGTPVASFTSTHVDWGNSSGAFKNFASATGLASDAASSAQSGSTNRALGIRQTGSFGDFGAAFQLDLANTTGKASFVLKWNHHMLSVQARSTVWSVQYSTNGGTTWATIGTYSDPGAFGITTATYNFGPALDNISGQVQIRVAALSASTGSGSRDSYAIDDVELSWSAFDENQAAAPTFDPPQGEYLSGINVVLASATEGATIRFTTDGSEPTESSTAYTQAIAISDDATSSTIKSKAFKEGLSASATASATYSFPEKVATIAALRAKPKGSFRYKLTSEAVFYFGQTTRNQKFIFDATGGLLIDDNAAVIKTVYEKGDVIQNLSGVFSEFQGMLQFVPLADPGAPVAKNGKVTPFEVSLSQLETDYESFEARLVLLKNVTFSGATGNFAAATSYPVSQNGATGTFRTSYTVDYIGNPVPNTPKDLIVVPNESTAGKFVTALYANDILEPSQENVERPTTGASSFAILSVESQSARFGFTPGNGAGRLVIMREGSAVTGVPKDSTVYPASLSFGNGAQIGTGNFVVSSGPAAELIVDNLKPETTYHFTVYEFNGTGLSTLYLKDVSFNGTSFTTIKNTTLGANDLFFSEYGEGSSFNKVLEIYNGTGADVDLSKYRINGINRSSDGSTGEVDILTWPTGTMLTNGDVRVIVDKDAADATLKTAGDDFPTYNDATQRAGAASFNGNDARTLEKFNGTAWVVVDAFGDINNLPATSWAVAGVDGASLDRTIVRKASIFSGNTNWDNSRGTSADDSEWIVKAKDDFTDIGKHTFSPGDISNPGQFTAEAVSPTENRLDWKKNASGHRVLVAVNNSLNFTNPSTGVSYEAGATLGTASILYNGLDEQFNHTGLTPNTVYFYRVWSYDDTKAYSPGVTRDIRTLKNRPSEHVTGLSVGTISGSSLTFNWTDAAGTSAPDGYLVLIGASAAAISNPVDGTDPVPTSTIKKVPQGVRSVTFNVLTPKTTYTVKVFPYTNSGSKITYKLDGSVPVAQGTTTDQSLYENIGGNLKGDQLITALQTDFYPARVETYNDAREYMYASLDVGPDDSLRCIYTNYAIKINAGGGGRNQAAAGGINAEHTWPQSRGADAGSPNSDMHHLFPSWENANSARSNHPFAEIDDSKTTTWWGRGTVGGLKTTPPAQIRDQYSELIDSFNAERWEVREDHKGNTARAIFYFFAIYRNTQVNASNQQLKDYTFDGSSGQQWFDLMKNDLYKWHYQDPPDEREISRSTNVATKQGNRNPFVHDTTLIRRAFFPQFSGDGGLTFDLSKRNLDFGVRRLNVADTLWLTITNKSADSTLKITSIQVTGSTTFTAGASLLNINPTKTGRIPVAFIPVNSTQQSGTLQFSTNYSDTPVQIDLTGAGGQYALGYRPALLELDIDNQQNNQRRFAIVNTGEALARIDRVYPSKTFAPNVQMFISKVLPVEILAGDSVVVDVEVDLSAYTQAAQDSIFVEAYGERLVVPMVVKIVSSTPNEEEVNITSFRLHQNHPNPFNPSTSIRFDLPEAGNVTLEVFNLTGQRVAILANRAFSAGSHQLPFDASALSSGIYMYRIQTVKQSAIRKMMLVK